MSCQNCGSHRVVREAFWRRYKCAGCGNILKISVHPLNHFSLNKGQRVAVLRPNSDERLVYVYKGWLGFCNLILDDFKQELGEISEEDIFLKERDFVKWAKSKESKMKLPEYENEASQKQLEEWLQKK